MNGKQKVVAFAGIILVFLIALGFIVLIGGLVENNERMDTEIEYLESLGWIPEGAEVQYSSWHAEDNTENWKNFWVWIDYENSPWNNTRGYIWYNHDGEYYFEEDLD